MSGDYRKTSSGNFCVMRRMTTNNRRALREAFKKNNDETYAYLRGGGSRGSFSICYHERF